MLEDVFAKTYFYLTRRGCTRPPLFDRMAADAPFRSHLRVLGWLLAEELAAGADEDDRAVQREPAAWTVAMEQCRGHLHR